MEISAEMTDFNMIINNYTNEFVLTLFSNEQRIAYQYIDLEVSNIRHITHIQGVDTYLVTNSSLNKINFILVTKIISFFHEICPVSFYQDDYIISFIFDVFNLHVKSIKGNDYNPVAENVDGVSRFNYQMHMDEKVFEREEETKICIRNYSKRIVQELNNK
eukprot:gene4259-6038_t